MAVVVTHKIHEADESLRPSSPYSASESYGHAVTLGSLSVHQKRARSLVFPTEKLPVPALQKNALRFP